MTLYEAAKLALESLQELSVSPERFDWGPSYGLAKERQKTAIKALRKAIKEHKNPT